MNSTNYPESVREEQIRTVRRTLVLPEGRQTRERSDRDRGGNKPAKGHEAFLKALVATGAQVTVRLLSGPEVTGTLKHTDRYTLTVRHQNHQEGSEMIEEVIFKHGIESFFTTTPKPETALDV